MSRFVVVAAVLAVGACSGCSKPQAKEGGGNTIGNASQDRVAVPGGDNGAITGAPGGGGAESASKGGPEGPQFRLSPEEGKLAIETPANAKAGAEVIAKVIVTANEKYKVNEEFPTKITLDATQGVTFAKATLTAGGHDKDKGDADVFNDKQMTFLVKLTPAQNGTYTINGSFKFAVCDRAGSQCLPKREPIAIQVAAK
jgi:hypothetical protein